MIVPMEEYNPNVFNVEVLKYASIRGVEVSVKIAEVRQYASIIR
jgi:hypothetical protein